MVGAASTCATCEALTDKGVASPTVFHTFCIVILINQIMINRNEPGLTFSSASNKSAPGAVPSWLLPPMTMAYGRPPLPPMGSVAQEWSTLAPVGGVKKDF